ncbi:hypothetical protein V499_03728 [Pseudogymnoascus sp. VKM F-103]|nr:hypothetical protein V499_03728 [Pseudogymnoascus sp. VKM F-103]
MAGYKRPRCESESPADAEQSSGSVGAKKSKNANGETGSPKRKRPPRDRAEEQLLNRLDREQYEEVMKLLPNRFELAYREHYAREKFWDQFYSTEGPGTCPERRNQTLNSRVRKIVEERRKSCPWYFWGLEGYTRERFPKKWPHFYKDGDAGDASEDSQLLYPWDELNATTASSPATPKGADKTGLWDLPSSEMEKSIEDVKLQMAEIRTVLDEKEKKANELRKKTVAMVNELQRKTVTDCAKIEAEASEKVDEVRREAAALTNKIQTEADAKFNEIQTDVSKLEEAMKEKQTVLEVQEITPAARKANDSHGNQ